MRKQERFREVIEWFEANMPSPESELNYTNAYELLVAVILSAQCTDKRINMVTPALFKAFPTPELMAASTVDDIYNLIRSVSYPNNKAKNLHLMAGRLSSVYGGVVPSDVKELQTLAGVGRKTANVVVSVLFGQAAMAVDTHVFRVSNRIGLTTNSKTPLQSEQQLMKYIPTEKVARAHHWLILHGRYVCMARSPKCEVCGLTPWCKMYNSKKIRAQREMPNK